MSDDIHEVFAIKYASHARKRAENYIFGDPHDEMTSISYYVWAIKGPHGTFVCDTGFDEHAAKERGRKIIKPIGEGLKAIGIEPDHVDHVIATHLHWDHAGNYDLFPNARYHVQDTEMAYATGRCMCHQMLRIPFSESDVLAMVRKVFAYRVDFHDGTEELAPGITVHKVGGHSKGLQCVRVKTKRGYVVVASDSCHLYSHLDEGRVFPITYSVGDTLEGYRTLKKLASSRHHIVPGHDPDVAKIYPGAKGRAGELDRAARRGAEGFKELQLSRAKFPLSHNGRGLFGPLHDYLLHQSQVRECCLVMLCACSGEAASRHLRNRMRAGGQFGRNGAHCNPRGAIRRKAVHARRNSRKRERRNIVRAGEFERARIAGRKQRILVLVAAIPHRADCVDHIPRLQPIAARDLRIARVAAAEGCAFLPQLRSRRAVDCAVDTAAAKQALIGGVDDRVHVERGDVGDDDLEPRRPDFGGEQGHGRSIARRAAARAGYCATQPPSIE